MNSTKFFVLLGFITVFLVGLINVADAGQPSCRELRLFSCTKRPDCKIMKGFCYRKEDKYGERGWILGG